MLIKSIKAKVLIYFLLSAAVIVGVYAVITYHLVRHDIEKEVEKRLIIVGNFIKEAVNSDEIQGLSRRGRLYDKYVKKLAYLKNITEVEDIMIISPESELLFSLEDEKEEFFIMLNDFRLKKAAEGKIASSSFYEGVKGRHYKTAFVPLKTNGKVAGIIGVETKIAYLKYVKQYKNALFIAGIVILILAFLLSIVISSGITRSTIQLRKKAEQIAKRNFDENIKVSGEEEINVLSDTLDTMKNELRDYITNRERMATVGEFSAGVAHEIRNSLNVVSGYAELIKEGTSSPKITKKAADIVKNTMKMSEFLNNFLDYTKEFTPEFQEIELSSFLDEFLEEFSGDVAEAIEKDYEGKNGIIKADTYLIKKVLYNIIINAYQSINKKKKVIKVGLEKAGGGTAVIIEDNGSGIDTKFKDKIFQPFFTGKKDGTGLGLAMAYKIVKEIHRGDIMVESEKGRGTRFIITL